jgi:predicted RecA/RadA family phage recombinase
MPQATFIQEGHYIDHTPASALASGDVVVQGDLVGVTVRPLAAGELGSLAVDGICDFNKSTGVAFTVGTIL